MMREMADKGGGKKAETTRKLECGCKHAKVVHLIVDPETEV